MSENNKPIWPKMRQITRMPKQSWLSKKKPSPPRKNRKMEGQVWLTIMQDFMQNEGARKVLFLLALNIGDYVN